MSDHVTRCVDIVRLADQIAAHQLDDGSVPASAEHAVRPVLSRLLNRIELFPGRVGELLRTAAADLRRWNAGPLADPPAFDATIAELGCVAPLSASDEVGLIGVMQLANSGRDGYRLEALFGRCMRTAHPAGLEAHFPDRPEPTILTTVAATSGLTEGECLAVFPEQFLLRRRLAHQPFAVFIVDRFVGLYRQLTLARLPSIHPRWKPSTARCTDGELMQLRRAFAVLHERRHSVGNRPLPTNLGLNSDVFLGAFEEARVDLGVIGELQATSTPPALLLAELIYLDRTIRLSRLKSVSPSADALAGQLIVGYLERALGDLESIATLDDLTVPLAKLRSEMSLVEAVSDDAEYRIAATELVASHLGGRKNMSTSARPEPRAVSAEQIREILVREAVVDDASWSVDAPLISSGVMDSLDLIKVIAAIEEQFDVQFPDSALLQENFESCVSMVATLREI